MNLGADDPVCLCLGGSDRREKDFHVVPRRDAERAVHDRVRERFDEPNPNELAPRLRWQRLLERLGVVRDVTVTGAKTELNHGSLRHASPTATVLPRRELRKYHPLRRKHLIVRRVDAEFVPC